MTFLIWISAIFFVGCSGINRQNGNTESKYPPIENMDFRRVRDGEYTGSYNVNINSAKVCIFVTDGIVKKISILKHSHGPGYGADKLVEKIIKKQSLEVDGITGATKSSYVLKKAVANALSQGYRRPAD